MSSTGEQTQRNTNSVAPPRVQPSDNRGGREGYRAPEDAAAQSLAMVRSRLAR